jgi:hypothetical protein
MKNLKRLGAAVALTFVLTAAAVACGPGQIDTPPCYAAPETPDAATVPVQVDTPPAADTGTLVSVVDLTITLLESAIF